MEYTARCGLYGRRNMNETVNAAIKQKFGVFVRWCVWWKQFRELLIECLVHDIETAFPDSKDTGLIFSTNASLLGGRLGWSRPTGTSK